MAFQEVALNYNNGMKFYIILMLTLLANFTNNGVLLRALLKASVVYALRGCGIGFPSPYTIMCLSHDAICNLHISGSFSKYDFNCQY